MFSEETASLPVAASILSALNSDDEETMNEKANNVTKKKKKAKRLVLSDDEDDDDTKGQLILECPFWCLQIIQKNQTNFFPGFLP